MRGDRGAPSRRGGLPRRVRDGRSRAGHPGGRRHRVPVVLHDEAPHLHRPAPARGTGAGAPRGPGRRLHPRVRPHRGVRRRPTRGPPHPDRRPPDGGRRPTAPHRGPELRVPRGAPGRYDLRGGRCRRPRAGDPHARRGHASARRAPARLLPRRPLGLLAGHRRVRTSGRGRRRAALRDLPHRRGPRAARDGRDGVLGATPPTRPTRGELPGAPRRIAHARRRSDDVAVPRTTRVRVGRRRTGGHPRRLPAVLPGAARRWRARRRTGPRPQDARVRHPQPSAREPHGGGDVAGRDVPGGPDDGHGVRGSGSPSSSTLRPTGC